MNQATAQSTEHEPPRDARVRELIERRIADDIFTPRQEAAELVQVCTNHGMTCAQIAERCGVHTWTVFKWKEGKQAPKSAARFHTLAMCARGAQTFPVKRDRLTGMQTVIDELLRVHRWTHVELAAHLPIRSRASVSCWMRGLQKPGRRCTVRLRALAREAGLQACLLAICDQRLHEISQWERERTDRFKRMSERLYSTPAKRVRVAVPA